MLLKGNYHTHTKFCDGTSTPEEMIQQAIRLGFEQLGFSSHVDVHPVMDIPAYKTEIRRLIKKYEGEIEIFCGGELDSLYPERHPAGFDYLIGSVHNMDIGVECPLAVDWDVQTERLLREGFGGDGYRLCAAYYRMLAERYGKGDCCDWIGHFDLVTRFNDRMRFVDEEDPRYLGPALEALDVFAERGLPLEINTKQCHHGKIFPSERLLRYWKEKGGELIISSDAHRPEDLTKGFDEALDRAVRCGFDHVNMLKKQGDGIGFRPVGITD